MCVLNENSDLLPVQKHHNIHTHIHLLNKRLTDSNLYNDTVNIVVTAQ